MKYDENTQSTDIFSFKSMMSSCSNKKSTFLANFFFWGIQGFCWDYESLLFGIETQSLFRGAQNHEVCPLFIQSSSLRINEVPITNTILQPIQ